MEQTSHPAPPECVIVNRHAAGEVSISSDCDDHQRVDWLDGHDPSDQKQISKIEHDYPHAITITLVPCCRAYAQGRVRITWGDQTKCFDVDDARDLALKILGVASTAESESWDSSTGRKFEARLTEAAHRWKEA